MQNLRQRLIIGERHLTEINDFLVREDNHLVNSLLKTVEKYGGVDEINRKAKEARDLGALMSRLEARDSTYVKDLEWMIQQRDSRAFISIPEYHRKILGEKADSIKLYFC